MNEEILKAFTQLLAIVAMQDNIVSQEERTYVVNVFRHELDPDSIEKYLKLFDELAKKEKEAGIHDDKPSEKPVSVQATVRTLSICNKINKSLETRQKVLLLLKLMQLVAVDSRSLKLKSRVIDTIVAVFNISEDETRTMEKFIFHKPGDDTVDKEILMANARSPMEESKRHVLFPIEGDIVFLKLQSVDMIYAKYLGDEELSLNGSRMIPGQVYIFNNGSVIKTQMGTALFYSDLLPHYLESIQKTRLSFIANNIEYKFPSGEIGLRDISISEGPGKLVGIMGVSGAGKTTLLNTLSGIYTPSRGTVSLNGINIHDKDARAALRGSLGYIAQDDLLIEELTVYQNLYYNAKLCFGDSPESIIKARVDKLLKSLGLLERSNMKVGSIFNKTLSGGQRKRLNIALELIREPSVLFVDEPTSGLSSRDSENVMDLLKELTYKGKLILTVIHQPNSDIYKLFDEVLILDQGGYPIYYGNPIEAISHFKNAILQVDRKDGICPSCGNVNPDQIFNIIEEKTIDTSGNFTEKRKVEPRQWHALFRRLIPDHSLKEITEPPAKAISIPRQIKQLTIFSRRDLQTKLTDKQYLWLNLLEAPILALILASIVRYNNSYDNTAYLFRFNDNFPLFIMMSIIVALFLGLMVSAEEISRDRKILKREKFLNLSWNSYLASKTLILFTISAIQTLSFTLISVFLLEIKGITLYFWFTLFSVSCFGNILGLNISHAFRSSVTVYILIPLLIIPQMILSGLFVSFDKINEIIGNKAKVPLVADIMVTRWSFEAIAVRQFIENDYERLLYRFEQQESAASYKSTFYYEKLKELVNEVMFLMNSMSTNNNTDQKSDDWKQRRITRNLRILKKEIEKDKEFQALSGALSSKLSPEGFSPEVADQYHVYLDNLKETNLRKTNTAFEKKEKLIGILEKENFLQGTLNDLKDAYYNENMADLVKNRNAITKVTQYRNELYQLTDPIFIQNREYASPFDYRTNLFEPEKNLFSFRIKTPWFNLIVIWTQVLMLYLMLYIGILKRVMEFVHRQ